ncbi:MAG: ATP-binding protein [Melioribacteraceae bacterium]|nr:ATP-binding protein [Melioribacteraceae bacterium]
MSSIKIRSLKLKSKIILFIGVLFTFLMIGVSFFMLVQWRNLMIESNIERAEDITKAFSINILDALILSESNKTNIEDQLEYLVRDFSKKVNDIKFIAVVDNDNKIMAHSDLSAYSTNKGSLDISSNKTKKIVSAICEHPKYEWIIATVLPLQIAGKRWGVLQIGIDAKPLLNEIKSLFFVLTISTILFTIIILSIAYLSINKITSSFSELTNLLDNIDFELDELKEIPINNDEIGFLIRNVNALQKRLVNSREQLLNAQKQIYHAEKLASIGRLASGVAHEINNPLNGIKSCVYAINKNPENIGQNREYFGLISEGLNHIEMVVQKLLGFAHQQSQIVANVDISEAISKVVKLLNFQLNRKMTNLITNIDSELPTIHADANLIQEVIMNLLLNSIDAIDNNGTIKIDMGKKDDKNIFLNIEDDGEGIKKENLQIIFDPFYTSKEEGQGTGLGLSVSLGIIELHGGSIVVDSTPNKKTIFKIVLPIANKNKIRT